MLQVPLPAASNLAGVPVRRDHPAHVMLLLKPSRPPRRPSLPGTAPRDGWLQGSGRGIGKRRGDDDPLWMWFSSGSHYGIHALLKAPFVSGEEVTVLNYTREPSGLSRSLVCFKTHKEAS